MSIFTDQQLRFIAAQRVGRLATVDEKNQPHAVPVCYACNGASLYIALDTKPKRVAPQHLKRVRNILHNPQVALVIDRYSEDWSELAYVLVRGTASLLPPGAGEHSQAIASLRERYPQYLAMPIETQPVIAILPERVVAWGNIDL